MGKKSKVSTQNQILIYKQVLMPVWTYGIQLWACASKSTNETIQKFQNKALRIIMDVPWYVRDAVLKEIWGLTRFALSYSTTQLLTNCVS